MKFDKNNWKDIDINVDSIWLMGPRAKGGKRENNYHGNFAPQIPDQMIRRFTEENDVVLDLFMGSGTTLFEAERLKRNYIGFDINDEIINYVNNKMTDCQDIKFCINNCDVTNPQKTDKCIIENLKYINKKRVDLIIAHPPYMDIIKFTDKKEDLSNISDINTFTNAFIKSIENVWKYLRANKHFVLVLGDLYKNSEVIPLGFILMNAIKKNFNCKLKGIVIKDIIGNRGKQGIDALWHYKALKSDFYIFKHEYIFVFRKCNK